MTEPSQEAQGLRERIKIAIQTAQDSEGRLLYVIPPGVAGMYADAVMRVLIGQPYPEAHDDFYDTPCPPCCDVHGNDCATCRRATPAHAEWCDAPESHGSES